MLSRLAALLLFLLCVAPAHAQLSPEFKDLLSDVNGTLKDLWPGMTGPPVCAPQMVKMAKEGLQANLFTETAAQVVVEPLEIGAKIAAGSLGVPGGLITSYSLVRCGMGAEDVDSFKACALGEAIGYAGGKGLEKAGVEELQGALAGAAWDKAYGEIRAAIENYRGKPETVNWTAGGECQISVLANWNKRGRPGAEGGKIIVRVRAMNCRCPIGNALQEGSLRFSVPVHYVRAGSHQPGWAAGEPEEYVLEAQCCSQPRSDGRVHLFDSQGKRMRVPGDGDPADSSPPLPPPPEPVVQAPPPPPQPLWSVENPCPECLPFKQAMDENLAKATALQPAIEELRKKATDNLLRQEHARNRVEQLQKELSRQAGTGGSAYDPETGHTTSAWTQANGDVEVTVTDANGNVLSKRTRKRRDTAKLKAEIAKQEAALKLLEEEHARLEKELDDTLKLQAKHRKLAADALAALKQCIEEKCRRKLSLSCVMPESKPILIGPQEKFGESAESKVASVATGILGGALGGLLGGGGSDTGGDGPELRSDPVKDKQSFTDPGTGMKIQVGSAIQPDGRMLTSVNIDEAKEGEPVIHQIYRQRLAPKPLGMGAPAAPNEACNVENQQPLEWMPYAIWEAWWAKLRIQVFQSVDGGPWQKTSDTGWMDWGSGTNVLETGIMSAEDMKRSAWGSIGANRPVGAPKSAGAYFDFREPVVYDKPAPERLELHFAQAWKDPVVTTLMHLYPTYTRDGKVSYSQTPPAFNWNVMQKIKIGGGMQQIDPPNTPQPRESILDEIEYVPVIN